MKALIVICALACVARAEPSPPREIAVTGDAELKVVPDQVILTFAVDTQDKDLIAAKQQNDERVNKIMGVTQQFKID